ncbi:LOW QUALITY PROTEIN: uncharacterized protein LOC116423569, partial [Sarcophilus harrisii]|uniref:LOW QUALITY PROTEIN: uncharacterized protein LOC116423569 n=1 Tax=Sarcophilus harrisii TaxID=9305 RepID=UPI001301AEF4
GGGRRRRLVLGGRLWDPRSERSSAAAVSVPAPARWVLAASSCKGRSRAARTDRPPASPTNVWLAERPELLSAGEFPPEGLGAAPRSHRQPGVAAVRASGAGVASLGPEGSGKSSGLEIRRPRFETGGIKGIVGSWGRLPRSCKRLKGPSGPTSSFRREGKGGSQRKGFAPRSRSWLNRSSRAPFLGPHIIRGFVKTQSSQTEGQRSRGVAIAKSALFPRSPRFHFLPTGDS